MEYIVSIIFFLIGLAIFCIGFLLGALWGAEQTKRRLQVKYNIAYEALESIAGFYGAPYSLATDTLERLKKEDI